MNGGTYVTCIVFGVLTALATWYLGYEWSLWGATIIGLAAGITIGVTSDYFTSEEIGRASCRERVFE